MKKIMVYLLLFATMFAFGILLTGCGNNNGATEGQTTHTETTTEETVHAADPMTDEEQQTDDSEGCIEDSNDLLY